MKSKLQNGFVNCHAHIDRYGTARHFTSEEKSSHLFEKWKIVNKIKRQSSEEDYGHFEIGDGDYDYEGVYE